MAHFFFGLLLLVSASVARPNNNQGSASSEASESACPEGSAFLGTPIGGFCPTNAVLNNGNCCQHDGQEIPIPICPPSSEQVGEPTMDVCPEGTFTSGARPGEPSVCCRELQASIAPVILPSAGPEIPVAQCPPNSIQIGAPILEGACPEGSFYFGAMPGKPYLCCQDTPASLAPPRNQCPPGTSVSGVQLDGICPAGATTFPDNLCCSNVAPVPAAPNCPGQAEVVGLVFNGQCVTGTPVGDWCCPNTAPIPSAPNCPGQEAVVGLVQNGKCNSGFPVGEWCCPSPTIDSGNEAKKCPNGQQPVGPAMGGICMAGFTNVAGLCC